MIVISDTSPISNLIQIQQLDLLRKLYSRVLIPGAVYDELCQISSQASILDSEPWIECVKLQPGLILPELLQTLDLGEAEAISLAIQFKADFLLIDEQMGRSEARKRGIPITGILGVLLQAKSKGFIIAVTPHMDRLINDAGFRIKRDLYKYIKELAKE